MSPPIHATAAGVAFKPEHGADALADPRPCGFLEVHAENYMGAGGPPHALLERLADRYPLSVHGVGLSLAGPGRLSRSHLARLSGVCRRYRPALVSEHLAWSGTAGIHLPNLLPTPYTRAMLRRVADRVDAVQQTLGRVILIENPASYVAWETSWIDEAEFLSELASRSGCGLLLDVNNLHVSGVNLGVAPGPYLDRLDPARVGEIHLAGHAVTQDEGDHPLLLDTHGAPVDEAVWRLYGAALERFGPVPTLLERDRDVPPWAELRREADRAAGMLEDAARRRLGRAA